MPTTVMLCRWNGGWIEVAHANLTIYGRKEAFLSVGAAQSVEEATALGTGQLAEFAQTREDASAETDPADSALPYLAYDNGDTIQIADSDLTLQPTRVKSIQMVEDDNGEVLWTPVAGTLVIGEDEIFEPLNQAVDAGLRRQPTPPAPNRIRPA